MTNTQLKTQIDTDITNKTTTKSISPLNVGKNIKDVVDYTVQETTTKELLINKSTNITTDATSDIKYPTVKAVKTFVDASTGGLNGFKEFKGTLLQSGTSDPVITTFKNDFSGTITCVRLVAGTYTLSISGLTSTDYLNKSFCLIGSGNSPSRTRNEITIGNDGGSNYFFTIYSFNVSNNTPTDSLLARTSFQIIVKD